MKSCAIWLLALHAARFTSDFLLRCYRHALHLNDSSDGGGGGGSAKGFGDINDVKPWPNHSCSVLPFVVQQAQDVASDCPSPA